MAKVPEWLVQEIASMENFYAKPYWDVRQWSVGYGSKASGPNDIVDKAEARRRLLEELNESASYVDRHRPGLPEGIRGSLISLTYNAGPKWTKAGLGKAVKRGDWEDARRRFVQYTSPDPRLQKGLRNRRIRELGYWNEIPPEGSVAPAATVNEDPQNYRDPSRGTSRTQPLRSLPGRIIRGFGTLSTTARVALRNLLDRKSRTK
jgi:GH24 family phage-related lysozyme (muramidase)